jgi:hypothetical protein
LIALIVVLVLVGVILVVLWLRSAEGKRWVAKQRRAWKRRFAKHGPDG